jgi:DNA-binding transcriptional ArsR family regulator
MKDPLRPERCAQLLAALAAPERLRIVQFLQAGPKKVTEIARLLNTSVGNTSHHLGVLRRAGLVRSDRLSRYQIYSLPVSVFQPEPGSNPTTHLNLGCCRLELPRAAD